MARRDSWLYLWEGNIFLLICLKCKKGHADKRNFEQRKERGEKVILSGDRLENQPSSFVVEDMSCCYCQKTSI